MDWLDDKRDEVLEDDYFIDAQLMAKNCLKCFRP